jgi:Txe/YoeB family toxin of Txe-Axe toxin-antitoxin module
MNTTPRFPDSGENDLPRELVDLAQKIADLPEPLQKDLEAAYSRVVESVRRRRRILALVQEALSQLRLDIKYLMFDLEVTRKERDELKTQLEHD